MMEGVLVAPRGKEDLPVLGVLFVAAVRFNFSVSCSPVVSCKSSCNESHSLFANQTCSVSPLSFLWCHNCSVGDAVSAGIWCRV